MSWLNENTVIYQIMVDRFSTGNTKKDFSLAGKTSKKWMGGNLKGIIKHLRYLKKLGVTAVYLTPILKGKYYHGYHTIDYFEIDPHFGNKKQFKNLIEKLHKNKIKIIFDFVPNHCSDLHPFFIDAVKNPESKYRSWFVFEKWPAEYLTYLDIKETPKFNLKNKEVREHLISVGSYWIKRFDIDGFRIDYAIGPPIVFWKELRKSLKKIKEDFAFMGEVGLGRGFTCGSPEVPKKESLKTVWCLESFSKAEKELLENYLRKPSLNLLIKLNEIWMLKLEKYFDGFIDFVFRDIIWAFAKNEINYLQALELLEEHYKKFKKKTALITLLSNHDFNRFLYVFGKEKTIAFSSFQFLIDQPALVYYGEESGLSQNSRVDNRVPYSDIEARRFMNWSDINREMFEHYQNLIKIKTR